MIAAWFAAALSATIVSVDAFGAKPDAREDACSSVQRAIQSLSEGDTLRFPNGEYHFYAHSAAQRELYLSNTDVSNPRRVAIPLEGLRNVRIEGSPRTRLVFHGRVMPFLIDRCQNVVVKGFEVDWERPLMSQFEVVASDEGGVTLRTDPKQYPYAVRGGRLVFLVEGEERPPAWWMEFDPKTRGVAYGTGDAGCMGGDAGSATVTELRPGLLRLAYPKREDRPTVGNRLICRHGVRDHAGTFIQESRDVRMENVAFRHTSGLGVLCQRSENLTFRKVEFRPTEASERLFSGHDDGFHISNCRGRVTIEDCWFDGLMDDPINVHGTSVRAIRREGPRTWVVRMMHHQSQGFPFGDVGDSVSFLSKATMESYGTAALAKVERLSLSDIRLEFDRDAPSTFQEGDAIENLTWTPSATIRRNHFGPVRARGLLVSTPKPVRIEDNVFLSSGSAILIAGDANGWYESGAVRDVLIRRNRFENCLTSTYQFCEAVISVYPELPQDAGPAFHRNIRIQDNAFVSFQRPILWAKSVDGLEFTGNRIEGSRAFAPWHDTREGLTFIDCSNVRVERNRLGPLFEGRSTKVVRGQPCTIRIDGWD